MTWKRMLWLMAFFMLAVLLAVHFFVSRLNVPGSTQEVLGVRSVFPPGPRIPIAGAKNGWQGFAFSGRFRFFRRASPNPREDFQKLKLKNFLTSPLQADLDLFEGGLYVLQRAGKGYRMFCLFCKGGYNYWADMASANSIHFSRQAFERFILHLRIDGQGALPTVAGQIASLHRRISPFFIQTPAQLLALMAAICLVVLLATAAGLRFSGSCPRRDGSGLEACTPGATLIVKGHGRRQVTACCLCREGDLLVIYRFRRPYMKIDLRVQRQDIAWEKRGFRFYKNRVILEEEDFQRWRLRLMA
jgi:hypothetical protein